VLRGEAGVGKSALLGYLAGRVEGWSMARAVGVESEMELPYSALHQLCAPLLDHLERVPLPQREALTTVFGRSEGAAPNPFLVGLGTLTLLAEVAEAQPLLCIVDDAQWLDHASRQILVFLARRLLAERIGLVCAARSGVEDSVLSELPSLAIGGLEDHDARTLLRASVQGPLDPDVLDQVIAESHGNPLALLELPRTWNAAELAGGFGLSEGRAVTGKIERSYLRRLRQLPADTQRFVLAAAAEPLGDPQLLRRALKRLGVDLAAADPAVADGLLRLGARVEFPHPLVRSAAYRSAPAGERQAVHGALAEATDAETDPDRRAWHRANATSGPDDEVAAELERSAARAQSRGGLAATAAFLERATALTVAPLPRARRALAAAEVKQQAGSLDEALTLLDIAEAGPLNEVERIRSVRLRARIAFASRRSSDARQLLLQAARDAEAVDVDIARTTYLEAMHAGLHAGRLDPESLIAISEAVLASRPPSRPQGPIDLLLNGLATRMARGYAAGAPILKEALNAFREEKDPASADAHWTGLACRVASDLWDEDTALLLSTRELERARRIGALAAIPFMLETRSASLALLGELRTAALLLDETQAVGEAAGVRWHSHSAVLLAALRGRETEATSLIEKAKVEATEHGEGLALAVADYVTAILYNGLGRYEAALDAVRHAAERHYEIGSPIRAVAELVEAAARSGNRKIAEEALTRLAETTRASGTQGALAVEARSRALLSDGEAADALYGEAIERLSATPLHPDIARTHLLYGEWLRREGRRVDAREHLRLAYETFDMIGMEAFAERARRESTATGATVRRGGFARRDELTAQEEQIGRLAREGLTNPEIGAMLFLSPRTVEWHLRKVFSKLGISSRRQLAVALPEAPSAHATRVQAASGSA
jgi:DNA-binding CsgD family transcriptional regulator/tetratricopeptide (TPR) repeat protein